MTEKEITLAILALLSEMVHELESNGRLDTKFFLETIDNIEDELTQPKER